MEAQSLGSHQHSWWFSCFSLREKLARSHNKIPAITGQQGLSLQTLQHIVNMLDRFFTAEQVNSIW